MSAAVCFLVLLRPPLADAQDEPPNASQQAVTLFNEGQDAHEKGDFRTAIDLYNKALSILPAFPEAELQKGNAQLGLGINADAEASFRKAVELRPDWTLALATLGSLLVSQERFSDARPIVRKAIELDEQNFPALAAFAEILIKTNASKDETNVLLAKLRDLTNKANIPADIWSARGALENANGDAKAARSSLMRARQIDPKNRAAIAGLMDIALAEGDLESAKGLVAELKLVTKESDAFKLLQSRLLAAENKPDEAIAVIDSIKNKSESAIRLRSSIVTSRLTDAHELVKRLEGDSGNLEILAKLCSLERVSDPPAALEHCRRASELDPQNVTHAIGYGRALVQARRFNDAAQLMRSLVGFAPENVTVHAELATSLFELKQYKEAKPEFEWLAEKQPERPIPYYFLAITHDQLQEYMDAMANYQRFLKLADPQGQKLEIDKVNLRLPALQKLIKDKKGKRQ